MALSPRSGAEPWQETPWTSTRISIRRVSAIDAAICRFGRYDKFRGDFVLIMNELPAQTVTVLFLNRSDNQNPGIGRNQIHIFHDLCTIHGGNDAAFLVRPPRPPISVSVSNPLYGSNFPVVDVANANCVDMAIIGDNLIAISHPAEHVSFGSISTLSKPTFSISIAIRRITPSLISAFAGNCDQISKNLVISVSYPFALF